MSFDSHPEQLTTLDHSVLKQLRLDLEEDCDMVIDSYLESIDDYLGEIENRHAQTSPADLHRWAHTIKSSAASIGAVRLAQLAAQMEHAFQARQSQDIDAQLRNMQQEYQLVFTDLGK